MKTAVLVAEPERDIRGFLERQLASDGFQVLGVDAPGEAVELAERVRPAVVLAGLEVCRRLREGSPGEGWRRRVPVIVLGEEQDNAVDRVRAFSRGCDDYVERPFHYEELLARIRALLRRSGPEEPDVIRAGELEVDPAARTVRVCGVRIDLSSKEYGFLLRLASDPTRVFTKEELLTEVWGYLSPVVTRTLDSHAYRVRRKLAAVTDTPYVLSVWGVGYRLMLPAYRATTGSQPSS